MKIFQRSPRACRRATSGCPNEQAEFLARHWGQEVAGKGVVLRGDPAHKIVNPVLYHLEEARACWQEIRAPVLWVEGRGIRNPAAACT
jgi:hypothetical protein